MYGCFTIDTNQVEAMYLLVAFKHGEMLCHLNEECYLGNYTLILRKIHN